MQWDPDLRFRRREMKIRGHHARDLSADSFEFNGSPNYVRVSAETLLAEAGLLDPDSSAGPGTVADPGSGPSFPDVEAAIRADQRLGDDQKAALITVYRSMLRPT